MGAGRRLIAVTAGVLAALTVAGAGTAVADDAAPRRRAPMPSVLRAGGSVETLYFGRRNHAVRVVRGVGPAARPPPRSPRPQVVSFGAAARRVTVLRGMAAIAVSRHRIETVSFADPRQPAVTVVRGPALHDAFLSDLFGPADGAELDRIAFAVDGIESRHGADPRMWRPEPDGPQGPMQVSAAAAFDVGGGDRFDLGQNRRLGRAYLAQMYHRYGNWPDALAAYNWGPGNMDRWIAGGRRAEALPPIVAYYVSRVLRDALITTAGGP